MCRGQKLGLAEVSAELWARKGPPWVWVLFSGLFWAEGKENH